MLRQITGAFIVLLLVVFQEGKPDGPRIVRWKELIPGVQRMLSRKPAKPIVVNTWPVTAPTEAAYQILTNGLGGSAIDAVVNGCSVAEEDRTFTTVGFGGSPDEQGNTTLDALVMDGDTMDAGAVAAMPHIKEAAQVAKAVLRSTKHTLIVGHRATELAESLGFHRTSLSSNQSIADWQTWEKARCQPNYRTYSRWIPDPTRSCGPYRGQNLRDPRFSARSDMLIDENNHDTIGMIAIDKWGSMAVGTSSNGAKFRIPGRVGDTPIPGAGGYVDSKVGGAVGTGDGDVLMRFLLTFRVVELMRQGKTPTEACEESLKSVKQKGIWSGALVALRADGQFGGACMGFQAFALAVQDSESENGARIIAIPCQTPASPA